ncbi:MAG: hypothetical protein ABSF63_01655 [Candidatus Bathyarchaeia archaeon]|jgi:hypothetical protein
MAATILGEASFDVNLVLDWRFGPTRETLRSALINAATENGTVKIPDQYRDKWMGEVELRDNRFHVTIVGII